MNKKGVAGIELVKPVVLAVLILGVLVIASIIAVSTLRDTVETSATVITGSPVTNETIAYSATRTSLGVDLSKAPYRNCKATVTTCYNSTYGVLAISSGNYSVSACTIKAVGVVATNVYNDTNWKCSYTWTYNDPWANDVSGNLTTGPANFFRQLPTMFILLAVVVLILIIVIVIVTVSRFGGGEGGASMGGGNLSLRTGGGGDEL